MSYSNGSVKELLLDSSIFSQSRCEFRVPANSSVLSNMKLVGLGGYCDWCWGNIVILQSWGWCGFPY